MYILRKWVKRVVCAILMGLWLIFPAIAPSAESGFWSHTQGSKSARANRFVTDAFNVELRQGLPELSDDERQEIRDAKVDAIFRNITWVGAAKDEYNEYLQATAEMEPATDTDTELLGSAAESGGFLLSEDYVQTAIYICSSKMETLDAPDSSGEALPLWFNVAVMSGSLVFMLFLVMNAIDHLHKH